MASFLESYLNKLVQIMTCDGRQIMGFLEGYDQVTNLIITEARERVFSTQHGVKDVPLGMYVIRGDNVAAVGEVDEELDQRIDFEEVFVPPLGPIWEMQ
uniref:U6 snRNA-associated Sm-like protein LSm8 n=1 Tax=Panagrolaimus superbus TaxID=310955 RepID=A0A914XWR4_9BILA